MNGGFGALEKRKTDLPKTGQEQNMCYRKRLASERWKKVLSTHGTVTPCEPNQPSPWPGWLLRNTPWLIAPGPTADWLGLLSSQGSSLHGLTIHYSPWHELLSSSITCDSSSSCEIMSGLENWYPVEEGESWHGVYAAPTATHSFASKDSETIRKMQIHRRKMKPVPNKFVLWRPLAMSGDIFIITTSGRGGSTIDVCRWRPGMLLSIVQGTGFSAEWCGLRSTVPRLRNSALESKLKRGMRAVCWALYVFSMGIWWWSCSKSEQCKILFLLWQPSFPWS